MPHDDSTPFSLSNPSKSGKPRSDEDHSDLAGQVFGSWTVVEKHPDGISKKWICKCVCGTIKVRFRSELVNGKSRRCQRCYFKWKCETEADMTGEVYGDWTVVEKSKRLNPQGHATSWVCRCRCGTVKSVTRFALVGNQSTRCRKCQGKSKYELPQVGERSGSYTVVKEGPRQGRSRVWLCRCDCGTERLISLSNFRSKLRQNRCKSCSVYAKFVPWKRVFNTIKRRATERGLEFDLTVEFLEDLLVKQDYKCALSGVPLDLGGVSEYVKKGIGTASLDRIDSMKGYIETNVQWVHKFVNLMKMDSDQDEFIDFCAKIVAHTAKKTQPRKRQSASIVQQPRLPLT